MQLALLSILTSTSLTSVFTAWYLICNDAMTSIYNNEFGPNLLEQAS